MDVANVIGTHATLDSSGSFEVALLGDLLLKWWFLMFLDSFRDVFGPHVDLALLLCNVR
jgi:hypothetical protein